MKSALRLIWTLTMILLSGCAPEGAPFPSSFKVTGPGQFEFVARGNWVYPANTASGEAERLTWLRGYISEHQICPSEFTIVERTPERSTESSRLGRKGSPKVITDNQLIGSVKYVGRCESSP
jgi:hypothetical protein